MYIAKYLDTPQALQQCKHKAILKDIIELLLDRARSGARTHILKVKSHIGIKGNEEADKLATEAVKPEGCSEEYTIGREGLHGLHWPTINIDKPNSDGTHRTEEHMTGNLNAALKRAVHHECQAGNANKTLYVELWEQVQAKLLPHTAQHIWTSSAVTHRMLLNVLKAQFGQLWNMNMAYVRKMPYM